jgi:hypothetical protein
MANRASVLVVPFSSMSSMASLSHFNFLNNSEFSYYYISGEFWWLPLPATSALGLSIGGQVNARFHSREQSEFQRHSAGASAGLVRRWSDKTSLRTSLTFNLIKYPNANSADRSSLEFLVGSNLQPAGQNTFDIMIKTGVHRYRFLDKTFILFDPNDPARSLETGSSGFLGFSLLWSRPINERNGLAISAGGQTLLGIDNKLLFGATTGYLTPWNDLTNQLESSLKLKSFTIPRAVSTLILWVERSRFHSAVENAEVTPIQSARRDDDRVGAKLNFMVPLLSTKSLAGRANINFSYINNESTLPRYNFNSWDCSALLEFEF